MDQQISDILVKQDAAIAADELGALRTYFSELHEDVKPAEWVNGIPRTGICDAPAGWV